MTTYGTTATIIGMIEEEYVDPNFGTKHKRQVFVGKSDLGNPLTIKLVSSRRQSSSSWNTICRYCNIAIETATDDVIGKITHVPIDNVSIDMESINRIKDDINVDGFECDIFTVSKYGLNRGFNQERSSGYFQISKHLFMEKKIEVI